MSKKFSEMLIKIGLFALLYGILSITYIFRIDFGFMIISMVICWTLVDFASKVR